MRHGVAPLLRGARARHVTVWPQWPYDDQARTAKPVGDPRFRWPPGALKEHQAGDVMSRHEVELFKKKIYRKVWEDMVWLDWSTWERRFWELKERAIPYDETTYTLLLHGYVLSHRHQSENAFLVLEEMKKAETHPAPLRQLLEKPSEALLRLNERMLNSVFELQELGLRCEASLWQNVVRLCYHSSVRFQKKRRKRLKQDSTPLSNCFGLRRVASAR